VTQELPEIRSQLDQIIDEWVDSPPALQGLLEDFRPVVEFLGRVKVQRTPDPSKDEAEDQGRGLADPLATITLGEELSALDRLADRGERLAALLADAERSLSEMGWEVSEEGKLEQVRGGATGRKSSYLTKTIRGLYEYLRPLYRRTFSDADINPRSLREQISRLLSPYFESDEVNPDRPGPIWHAINNHLYPPDPAGP
jgi:hypothetical protein